MSTVEQSFTSRLMTFVLSFPAVILCGVVAIGLWMGVFTRLSAMQHNWSDISSQVKKVIGSTTTAMLILLIASTIYFLQDQGNAIIYIFILLGIAAGLSYGALAASSAN